MGLYQGLNSRREVEAPRPLAGLRTLRVNSASGSSRPGFWQSMLGRPAASVAGAGQRLRRTAASGQVGSNAPAPSWRAQRLETLGADATPLPRRRGLLRSLLVLGLGAWALAAVKPWQSMGDLGGELGALFQAPPPAANPAAEERKAAAQEQARLATLPVLPGGGQPLALYHDSAGRWWRVNAQGVLSPTLSPAAPGNLGLPELLGLSPRSRERRGGRELVLKAEEGLLEAVLPIDGAIASEVRALDLHDSANVGLLTHDGSRAELGREDLAAKQRRLALVLADLAAKKRRAERVDLRFEGSAVVRLASR